MSRIYDSWEKLVGAVLKREELRRIALCESFSSSSSADFSSRNSFNSASGDALAGSRSSGEMFDLSDPLFSHYLMAIQFKELAKATKNFAPEMLSGEGEYGYVIKGWIDGHSLTAVNPGSGIAIVVKNRNFRGWQRDTTLWLKEFECVRQIHHPNLVRLIGFCFEEPNRLLVYEFMCRGSLDYHLFINVGTLYIRNNQRFITDNIFRDINKVNRISESIEASSPTKSWEDYRQCIQQIYRRHQSLPWETRIKVAIGAARGLSFLHNLAVPITYRCFKAKDIVLDNEYNAKLSGFGFAKDAPIGKMPSGLIHNMRPLGFVAPEYVTTGLPTRECDVFSFGIVLLELLSGIQFEELLHQNGAELRPYDENIVLQIINTILDRLDGRYPKEEASKVATLAFQCLSSSPKERPTMAEVVVALERF